LEYDEAQQVWVHRLTGMKREKGDKHGLMPRKVFGGRCAVFFIHLTGGPPVPSLHPIAIVALTTLTGVNYTNALIKNMLIAIAWLYRMTGRRQPIEQKCAGDSWKQLQRVRHCCQIS
jgi:hypothetical protein